jgi:O-antigen/teichoic acid export membrane protein
MDQPSQTPLSPLARLRSTLLNRDIQRRVLAPITGDSLGLVVNLITGVLVARLLGTSGRGEIAAILAITQMLSWAFSLGSAEAAAYHIARHPHDGGRIIATWMAVLVPSIVVAIGVGELLLPILFDAQTAETLRYAQVFIFVVIAYVILDFMYGVLAGDHDFIALNVLKLAVPATVAAIYIVLWRVGSFTVESALIANAVAAGSMMVVTAGRAIRRCGFQRPEVGLAKTNAAYALKAHLGNIGGFMTARLDLMIIPAFLAASSVGLYSIATNVASIIPTLTATLAIMVLPAAARAGTNSVRTVIRSLHLTMGISLLVAIFMGILAGFLVKLVYGSAFEGSVTSLRILLPGMVVDAGAAVLWSGLLAAGFPARAAAGAAMGLIVTLVGLVLVLPQGGIEGAAIVSTLSYATAFLATAWIYKRSVGLSWATFFKAPPMKDPEPQTSSA